MKEIDLTEALTAIFKKHDIYVTRVLYWETNYLSIYVENAKEVERSKKITSVRGNEILIDVRNYIKSHVQKIQKYEWHVGGICQFYSYEDLVMNKLIREKKELIVQHLIMSDLGEFRPKYVFAHSSNDSVEYPSGYTIVFAEEDLLHKSVRNGMQDRINSIIRTQLSKDERYLDQRFKVSFSYAQDPNIYGMSRED